MRQSAIETGAETMNTPTVIDRARCSNALETCQRLASMAGKARPAFVTWGTVYETPEGNFRMASEFPRKGQRFQIIAYVERVK